MDLSLFTGQTVDVRLKNQTVYENVKLQKCGLHFSIYSGLEFNVYSSGGSAVSISTPDAGLDIEDIQLSHINLNDYVGFTVNITLRNWEKHQCLLLRNTSSNFPFISHNTQTAWTEKGKWSLVDNSLQDIIHIQHSKPQTLIMNRPEILSAIAETKKQLTVLEEQLAQSPITLQNAVVGDVLADGSEVVYKWPDGALLAAPAKFNMHVRHTENPSFELYLTGLGTRLNRWEWFIPTAEHLNLAFGSLNLNNPNRVPYWTSSRKLWGPNDPDKTGRIRAFRYVTY